MHVNGVSETPDAWGFNSYGQTMLLEAKASRSDFLADKRKFFRRLPALGLGQFRYYIAPSGVISQQDLPPRWGLIIANGDRCRRVVRAAPQLVWGEVYERRFVMALLARLEYNSPRIDACGRVPKWGNENDTQ